MRSVWIAVLISLTLPVTGLIAQQEKKIISITIGYNTTTSLVFPADIDARDVGTADVMTDIVKKAPTVLKVKAAVANFQPTNLTVYTSDRRMYLLRIQYNEKPDSLFITIPPLVAIPTASTIPGQRMTAAAIKSFSAYIATLPGSNKRPATNAHKMTLRMRQVIIRDNILFFRFDVQNRAGIPYDIDFVRFYLHDRRKGKRTSNMEQEIIPLNVFHNKGQSIDGFASATIVAAFDKFTIADDKYFSAELFEKNGDRHLAVKLKGKNILKATSL